MLNVSLKIAFKFLTHKIQGTLGFVKKTFLLASVALLLSIICLIVLSSLSNGYIYSFKDKVSSIDSHINIYKINNKKILENEISQITSILDSIDSIDEYYVEASNKAILKDSNYSEGVIVKSIIKSKSKTIHSFVGNKKIERLSQNQCIIGKGIKDKFFIKENSTITLLNTDFMKSGILYNGALASKVVDDIYFGINDLDKSLIYINKQDFKKIFNNGSYDGNNIKIFLNDLNKQDNIRSVLINALSQINLTLEVDTFNDRHNNFLTTLLDIFKSISIVIYILIGICLFNLTSSIWLIVESKNKDIEALKLFGMSNFYIYLIFLFITLITITISFVFGFICSYILVLCQNYFQIVNVSSEVYLVSKIIGILDYNFIAKIFLMLLLTSLLLSLMSFIKSSGITKWRKNNV